MVTVKFGADSGTCNGEGMRVRDILAKLRDAGIQGINRRLSAGEEVDVFVNGETANENQVLKPGDEVTISKPGRLGVRI
jgi:hypothetical protein